jgi:hypothetical protein
MEKIEQRNAFYFYSSFNNVFSYSDYTASSERVIVNNELDRIWKEVGNRAKRGGNRE